MFWHEQNSDIMEKKNKKENKNKIKKIREKVILQKKKYLWFCEQMVVGARMIYAKVKYQNQN